MEQLEVQLDQRAFSARIEDRVQAIPMPEMDAIIRCADAIGLEYESAAKLVNKNIKEKLEAEAQDLNLMKRVARLPI